MRNLSKLIKKSPFTVHQIALKLNYNYPAYYQRVKSGGLNYNDIKKLCKLLKCSFNDLG